MPPESRRVPDGPQDPAPPTTTVLCPDPTPAASATATATLTAPVPATAATALAMATANLVQRAVAPSEPPLASWPLGATIAGRYEVGGILGEGGMGTVYRAEQVWPVRRPVALKLIRVGADSRGVLARFDGERQALALMDHPHIARVLDGGTTEAGRPYFAMDLVDGLPLIAYCDQHRLPLRARLALLADVCRAVQHAHQKGIIHRDLKPTNILVEHRVGQPCPKVIDFGLAKAVDGSPLTDSSLLTAAGAVTGTPLYMAPEQAACAADIDTRADVYALGVILYELLTGSTPIPRESLRRVPLGEVLRLVREEEPPTPSRRIDALADRATLAARRQVEPTRLARLVRGELDWITMKALAKPREWRYGSATALADDIDRHLRDEPVLAGPPSTLYQAGKFLRRHRVPVVAATLVVLTLLAGIVGTTLGFRRAQQRAHQNEQIGEALMAIFLDLDPREAERTGRPLADLLGERLDRLARQIEGESIGDPVAVARMQLRLGATQANLGHYAEASALLAKCRATLATALGEDDPLTLTSTDKLGVAEVDAGHPDRAIPLLEATLARRRAVLGLGHPDAIDTLGNLAYAHQNARQYEQAVPLLQEALDLIRTHLGSGHPFELVCLGNLASCYRNLDQPAQAVATLERTLPLIRAKFGADHPDTLNAMVELASAYRDGGQLDRAIRLFDEALTLSRAKLGPDHPETATLLANLGQAHLLAGQVDRGLPLLEQALAAQEARLGADHPDTLQALDLLAVGHRQAHDWDRAIALDRRSAETLRRTQPSTPDQATRLAMLGSDLVSAQRWAEAEPILREALATRERLQPDQWTTFNTRSLLGAALLGQGRPTEARPLLVDGFQGLKRLQPQIRRPDRPRVAQALDRLIRLAEASGDPAEVQSWQAESQRLAATAASDAAAPDRP